MSDKLQVAIGTSITGLSKGLKAAQDQLKGFDGSVQKLTGSISNSFSGVGASLAGLVSAGAITALGKQVLTTTAEFEKFGAILGNTLGSQALSNLKLKEIQDFAAKTPNSVSELTGAFVKLANQGFQPTGDQMRKLGDVAASTGKTFDQLAEAIIDAQTGEYERLKEFGIRAKDAGDNVIFTFKGVQTQVTKSSEAIRNYITALGDAEGVSGSMAVISETLTGKISNLGDKWDQMLVSIGGNTTGVFSLAMTEIGDAIDKITQYNKQLELASKYKLSGSNFGQEINRALNPFASKGGTAIEKQVAGITIAQEETTKFVSSAIAGAKTAADFGRAIAQLSKKGNEYANLHLGESGFTKGEQRGIIDQYQQGIKALQDARAKFIENLNKGPESSFGKPAAKKTPADVLKTLGFELDTIKQTAGILGKTFGENFKDNIEAYSKAIGGLIDLGVDGNSPLVQGLKAQASALRDPVEEIKVQMKGVSDTVTGSFNTMNGLNASGLMQAAVAVSTAGALITGSIDKINSTNLLPFSEGLAAVAAQMQPHVSAMSGVLEQFNAELTHIINSGLTSALSGIGDAIGTALANGASIADSLGQTLLSTLGGVLSQLGQLAIATGVAMEGIKAAFESFGGVGAIAAGVALMALAGAVKAKVANMGSSIGAGSYSGGNMPMPATTYSAPRVPSYTSGAGGVNSYNGGRVVFEISGPNLIGVLNRAGSQLSSYRV